jgi:hypothetical protein
VTNPGALTWMNDLMQWLGRWFPRLVLVEPTHCGVLFGPGGSARASGPGLVLYWPITHHLVLIPTTTQSLQTCAQALPGDGRSNTLGLPTVTLCGAALQFKVVDPVRAATASLNVLALADNRTQAALARHQAQARIDWHAAAETEVRIELAAYGLAVERMDFIHAGQGVALKNLNDWQWSDNAAGKREEEATA